MTPNDVNARGARVRKMSGSVLGWLSIAFLLFGIYREIDFPFRLERTYAPGSVINLGFASIGQLIGGITTIVVCMVLGRLCLALQGAHAGLGICEHQPLHSNGDVAYWKIHLELRYHEERFH